MWAMKHLLDAVWAAGPSEMPASAGTATVIAPSTAGVASKVNVRLRMVWTASYRPFTWIRYL